MGRHLLLLLLLGLCSPRRSLCQIAVSVSNVTVQLVESGESLGPKLVIQKQTSLSISCSVTSDDELKDATVQWYKASSSEAADGDRFDASGQLSADKRTYTSTLTVRNAVDEDIVDYKCNASASGNVAVGVGGFQSKPLLTLRIDGKRTLDASVWPGNDVSILCDVAGNPPGDVQWSKDTDSDFAATNSSLVIRSLDYETDRGTIICRSKNSLGENTARLYLRVKNPRAFVLPLIILIAEVAIIAIIVVAYELVTRRHRQQEEQKAD